MILLDRALDYCNKIVNNEINSHWRVKKQCEKFLYDYNTRQYDDNFDFYFDEKKLKIVNNLLKLFIFSKGKYSGESVLKHLCGYQCLLICAIFGWRFKSNSSLFRYRNVVLYIARKNSKTYTVAYIFLLLMLTEDNYSEFYSICVSRDLASEVKKAMQQTVECSPALKKYFKVSKSKLGRITCLLTHSFYEPRTAQANSNNAINPSAFVSDEHASFTDKSNYSAMMSGQKQIKNPLTLITTTGYPESNSIMYEELNYIDKILTDEIENERYFALCYSSENEHLWDDIGIEQSNPLYSEELYQEIKDHREKVKIMTSEQEEYLTKEMNVLLESKSNEEHYLSKELWDKQIRPKKEVYKHFKGKRVSIGVDLSKTIDLTSVSIMCQEDNGDLYAMSMGFIAENTIFSDGRRENIDYYLESKNGNVIIQKDRNSISILQVCDYIKSIEKDFECEIITIYYDGAYSEILENELGEIYSMVELPQRMSTLSKYYKSFRDKLYEGGVFIADNNILNYCRSCAYVETGKVGDILVVKNRKDHSQKIDLLITIPFAFAEFYVEPADDYNPLDALMKAW